MATVTYQEISAQSKLELEDLLESEEILTLYKSIESVAKDKASLPSLSDFIGYLQNKSFYLPSLVVYENQIGVFLSSGFVPFSANFTIGEPIAALTKEKDEPVRYNVVFGEGDSKAEISVKFFPGTKYAAVLALESLVTTQDKKGDVVALTEAEQLLAIQKVVEILKPPALDTLPNGSYKVVSVKKAEKSTLLTLDNKLEVIANRACPEEVKEITAINGCLYASSNGKAQRGISTTGWSNRLISKDVKSQEELDSYIGKVYQVQGVVTSKGDNNDYQMLKLSEIADGVFGSPAWYHADSQVAQLALVKLAKGKSLQLVIDSVQKPTGKMVYPKANLEINKVG
jgi:hypothetical protein